MPLTQTKPQTELEPEQTTDETEELKNEPQQSVYIADQDLIKTYPISMSNNEIDFDLHTTVRGNPPEDYYVNFLPLKSIQDGFNEIVFGGLVGQAKVASELSEEVTKGFKYAVTGDLEQTYKPWLDIWRESVVGKEATELSDKFLAYAPAPVAAIPWFLAEFAPVELLEFGTSPMAWTGAYGIQKFGPPLINKTLSMLPENVRTFLLKDIFASEKSLAAEYETLGISQNSRTSEVTNAYRKAAKVTHPDIGGNRNEFERITQAYESILKSRRTWLKSFYEMTDFKARRLLSDRTGSVLIPTAGDLVKIGSEIGQVVKITGNIAAVNLAGKMIRMNTEELDVVPNESKRQTKFRKLIDEKDLVSPESKKEADFMLQNLEDFDVAYTKKLKKEYKTDNPNIISSDVSRTAEMKGRGELTPKGAAERHAGSSAYSKLRYEEMVSDPALADKDVTLMAGISGAGKTGAVRVGAPEALINDIIYDTNVASFESGKKIIEKALESNPDRRVNVFYVDRDPIKSFEEGVIPRYLDPKGDKRVLPIEAHMYNAKSIKAITELADYFKGNNRVTFHPIGNYGKKGSPGQYSRITLEDLSKKEYNLGEVRKTLEKGIQEKLNAGILSEEAAEAFLGRKITPKQSKGREVSGNFDRAAVNLQNLEVSKDARLNLVQATDAIKEELQNQTGKPMTHEEVIEKAKEADIISKGVSREATLEFQASLLKTRQHLAALAEENELTPEFLDALRVTSNLGTDIARNLESFKIEAVPEYAAVKMKIIKDLIKLGKSSEEILEASKGVDFTKEKSVAEFYRKFVEPTLPEILDEFVYMNILSSPLTHIVNAFSNALQLAGLNPLTKLASGAVDAVASGLTGAERKHYISEVPDFYKGALNAVPEAVQGAISALKGERNLERPDLRHIPTLSKVVDIATLGIGKYVPRALEASDVFFRTMVEGGEIESLSKRLGHTPDQKEMKKIESEARERADYYVFRKKPDADNKTGQGDLLSAIDQMTNAIYRLRSVPGFKWFIRFVQTPMNILKQGIEYSPAGFATLKGAEDKAEQGGKAVIGSLVFAGASWLAANNLTTWSSPTSQEEKNDFYAAGLQPYSVRIGDKWVSYSKIGPLAYPLAMAAALHHFTKESPKALSDNEMDKVVDAMTGVMKFFSDQSYMQGLADLVGFARGEKTRAVASAPTQLIPLSSFQGWVNNVIDPLQRKAEKGLSFKSVLDQIQMKIVGMSQFVPPQIDDEEVPVKKQMRGVNVISPLKVSQVDEGKLAEYKDTQRTKQEINKMKIEAQE